MRHYLTAILIALVLQACDDVSVPPPGAIGHLEGRHYTNSVFGLEILIPDSWDFTTEGIGHQIAESATERMPVSEAAAMKAVRPNIEYVFKASRKAEEAPGAPWLQLTMAIHHDGVSTGQATSEEYAQKYLRDIQRAVQEVRLIEPATVVKINGAEYCRIRYYARAGPMSINQCIYLRADGKDVAVIAGYYATDEHLKILSEILREE